ncbi:MAG: cyclase family protein [Thermodesulfobacteriota bacterium]
MAEKTGSNPGANKSAWIDITIPLRNAMVHWPEDPVPPQIGRILDVERGDKVTMSQINIISHTGTHMDAPLHFIYGGGTIDEMPLDTAMGPARVIEIRDTESIKPRELVDCSIQPGERILFKTRNSSRVYQTDEFVEDYVYVSTEAAHFLVEKRIRVIGLDYISLGSHKDMPNLVETHETLLKNGIYIIEGINLSGVKAGRYELICLPLRLERGDAGPSRAILRPL